MPDTSYVIHAVAEIISSRIQVLKDAELQIDNTLLQVRMLTLAIVVGIALLSGKIENTVAKKSFATALLLMILLMPFAYDLFARDQQSMRSILRQQYECDLLDLQNLDLTYLQGYPTVLEQHDETTVLERWERRFSRVELFQGCWYLGCLLIGTAIIWVKDSITES